MNLSIFARHLRVARNRWGVTQQHLANSCGLHQSAIALLENGKRQPTLDESVRLAEVLNVPLQWFLSGTVQPGTEVSDLTVELIHLGVRDLLMGGASVPGAFRSPEEVVAHVLAGDVPDARIVEAIPAVLAWNKWRVPLLRAYAETVDDARVPRRIAWLADVTLTLHRLEPFPGGLRDARALESFTRQTPVPLEEDDLGRPGASEASARVSRLWKITYDVPLSTFRERARKLHTL